jgi:hypothetical protein
MRQSCECSNKQKEGGDDDAQCGLVALLPRFFWTQLTLAPSFRVAEQGARLRDWRKVPALGLGKRDIFIHVCRKSAQYASVFMRFMADDARHDQYPS